jgi:hypothetical protein
VPRARREQQRIEQNSCALARAPFAAPGSPEHSTARTAFDCTPGAQQSISHQAILDVATRLFTDRQMKVSAPAATMFCFYMGRQMHLRLRYWFRV